MGLPSDLLSQFVKITNDKPKTRPETTVYGTVVYDGRPYVRIDGSDLLTPVSTTTNVKDGERVTVMIKNHTATVTGNLSSPAARTGDVEEVADQVSEFEIVMAYKVTTEDLEAANATIESLRAKLATITELDAVYAEIDNLQAKFASLEHVNANDITALNANIESIQAMFGDFTDISADDLEALNAHITTLKGYTADFTYVSAEVLEAVKASIKELEAKKLSVDFANIDFANIDQAIFDKFYAESGIIQNVTISEGVAVKELVGVVIKADLFDANTLVVDNLVVRGSDRNYYKLSTDFSTMPGVEPVEGDSIHGSTIVARSVTAEKVSVDDLVAFGATIGGFVITDKALHSLVKASVDNSTPGVYLDNDGQMSIGDGSDYFRYRIVDTRYEYKYDEDGENVVIEDEITDIVRIDSDEALKLPGGVYSGTLSNGSRVYYTIFNIGLGDVYFEVERVDTRKIEIAAESILIGSSKKSTEHVKIGIVKDETGNEKPCIELAEGDSERKQVITNDGTVLMDGDTEKTIIDTEGVTGDTIKANRTFEQSGFVWAGRSNGNYGLSWKG